MQPTMTPPLTPLREITHTHAHLSIGAANIDMCVTSGRANDELCQGVLFWVDAPGYNSVHHTLPEAVKAAVAANMAVQS